VWVRVPHPGYQIAADGKEPALTALEAIALEGYPSDRLNVAEIRKPLGFETRMEVDALLKEHGAFLPSTEQDLEHDREIANQAARRAQTALRKRRSDQRRTG